MSAPVITQQFRIVELPDGRRAGVLDAVIPDDAPEAVREGFARRSIVNSGGTCPCGARWPRPNREQRRQLAKTGAWLEIDVIHDDPCPAAESTLLSAVHAWAGDRR